MIAAIVILFVGAALEAFAAIWFAAKADEASDEAQYSMERADAMTCERNSYRAALTRAVALLRDDAHRSRQTKDGTRRYDAWRAERDALIREVEG